MAGQRRLSRSRHGHTCARRALERGAPVLHHPQQLVPHTAFATRCRPITARRLRRSAEGADIQHVWERHPALDLAQTALAILRSPTQRRLFQDSSEE